MNFLQDKPELSSLVRSLEHHTILEEGDRVITPVARGKAIPAGTLGIVTDVWGNPPIAYEVDFEAPALSQGIKREYLLLVAKAAPQPPLPEKVELRDASNTLAPPPIPKSLVTVSSENKKRVADAEESGIARTSKLPKNEVH